MKYTSPYCEVIRAKIILLAEEGLPADCAAAFHKTTAMAATIVGFGLGYLKLGPNSEGPRLQEVAKSHTVVVGGRRAYRQRPRLSSLLAKLRRGGPHLCSPISAARQILRLKSGPASLQFIDFTSDNEGLQSLYSSS